jgi:hypothetical protein
MTAIVKYPRTQHLEGSRLQAGDEDLAAAPFATLRGRHLVVEEKIDGANCGVSFDARGELVLQSRGHALTGGGRERHFDLLKAWGTRHAAALRNRLGGRYVLYGEWLYAKHTVYYDQLPHYLLEFDVLDRERGRFLDTPTRRALLAGLPVTSVPVLHEGELPSLRALHALVRRSLYKGPRWRARLAEEAAGRGLDVDRVRRETDDADLSEGLYVKVESGGWVAGRYKHVRASFLSAVLAADGHWLDRPIVPNGLAAGVDLFAEAA